MNDLLSKLFKPGSSHGSHSHDSSLLSPLHPAEDVKINLNDNTSIHVNESLASFLQEIRGITVEMDHITHLFHKLQHGRETYQSLQNFQAMKALRHELDTDVDETLKKCRSVKGKLHDLDEATEQITDKSSSAYRIQIFLTKGLREKLKDLMHDFDALCQNMRDDYTDMVQRFYFTVTGEKPDYGATEELIEGGINEDFVRLAVEQYQGREQIVDTIQEIQEECNALKGIEQSLLQLRQVFLDMALLVEIQGEDLNDIEKAMLESASFIRTGATEFSAADYRRTDSRRCVWMITLSILILSIGVTVLVLYLLLRPSSQ